ncbi:MAG: ABC transporter ATP-binding protein [Lentisphaeria bacterium]|nr:ABC transporter ATP-binding protein [Lentisphaeria bacterium]
MACRSEFCCVGSFPDSVAAAAAEAGFTEFSGALAACADLQFDGTPGVSWLVLAQGRLAVFRPGVSTPCWGPMELTKVSKVRCFQAVGSAFLQVMVDGLYVMVVRYSNARRELFGRVRIQMERMLAGEEVQAEWVLRPSDWVCGACGLPLPGKGASCPRCSRRHGILLRSLGLMRPYTRYIAGLFTMMVIGVCLDLVPAQLTRLLVDKVLLPREHLDWLPLILLGLVGTSGSRCVLNIFIGRLSSLVGTQVTRELRQRLQAKLVSLSVDYYNRHSVGSLMSRVLYDVDFFHGFVAQVAQGFLLNIMLVAGVGAMLFLMNWRLALLVLLPIPFVIMGTMFFWKRIYPRYYRVWDSQSKMAQLLSGLLSGVRLVKAFGQEQREAERFGENAGYMQTARWRLDAGTATFNPLMGFVFGLGGLIVWLAGGRLVVGDRISLGTLMAFFGYLGMFYAPISALSMFSNWVTGFMSAAQRTFEILDSTATLPVSPNPVRMPTTQGTIEFRDVVFGYDPYTPVLKGVSFRVEAGQFIGIVGKSGSGKTSIVNLICRFYDVQGGQVLLDGVDVRDYAPEDLHRSIGLVLQDPFLFRGTIADNVAYGRPAAEALEIMDAARAANAHDFIARRASAYDTKLGENGAGLSGGERQRISIARALLCDPRILILDEATSSVDTESEQEIQRALAQLCRGRTTLAVAHRLSTLKNADRILVVDEGRIAECGTHDELLALENGIYRNLVRIQTELTRLEV